MFEHTLAGSMPPERSFRFGPVSAALIIHAGVLLAVAVVSVLTLQPIPGPNPPPQWVFPVLPPDLGLEPAGGGSQPRPAHPSRNEQAPVQPVRPTPPETVPDEIRDLDSTVPDESAVDSVDSSDASGSGGELTGNGEGSGSGLGNGSGSGDGPGHGDGPGDGAGTGPIELGPGIATPRLIVKVQPDYPIMARKIRLEGQVLLRAVVGPSGSVTSVEIVHSSNPMFNDAAISAVRQWRYTPPSQNGRPVSVWLDVLVKFTLR